MRRHASALAVAAVVCGVAAVGWANPDAARPPTPFDAYYFTPKVHLELSLFYEEHTDSMQTDRVSALDAAVSIRVSRGWQAGVRVPVLFGGEARETSGLGNLNLTATRLLELPFSAQGLLGTAFVVRGGMYLPTASNVLESPEAGPVTLHATMPGLYRNDVVAAHADAALRADALFWGGFFLELRGGFEVGDPSYALVRLGASAGMKPFITSLLRVLVDYDWTRQVSGDALSDAKGLHTLRPGIQIVYRDYSVGFRYLWWIDGPDNHMGGSCDFRVRF